MRNIASAVAALWLGMVGIHELYGQAKPEPDVLLFTSGERLTGHFVKSTGSSLTFKSDALGDVTVDWSKVKELQTTAKVAVIPKGVRLHKRADAANIPQGTLSVQDQQVHLAAETPKTIPVADTGSDYRSGRFPERSHAPAKILPSLEGSHHGRRRRGERDAR